MATFLRLSHLLLCSTLVLILLTFTQRTDPVLFTQILDNLQKIDALDCFKDKVGGVNQECLRQI